MGEDVGRYGGSYACSLGCSRSSAPSACATRRSRSRRSSARASARRSAGMRPIVEIMTVNFSLLALDQILNNAATLRHMSGGQVSVPLVIRMATGAGRQVAAQHSHSLENFYAHIPGLKVLAPATLEDARGMLWTALAGSRPGDHLRARDALQPRGRARRRTPAPCRSTARRCGAPGKDVTLIAYGGTRRQGARRGARRSPSAASTPRSSTCARCARSTTRRSSRRSRKTRRAVVVDEGWRTGSLAAEIVRAHHGAGVLRSRRAGRARVQRGGADPVRRSTSRRRRCRSPARSSTPRWRW